MEITERHESTYGLPDLIVAVEGEDWMVGFDGYAWHAHGDILHAWGYRRSPAEATRQFVDDVLASRRQIIIWRIGGKIDRLDVPVEREVDSHDVAEGLHRYCSSGESAEIWYWSGRHSVIA